MNMKYTFEEVLKRYSHVDYCCYCYEPKDDKISCCQENHFIQLKDFDHETQMEIAKAEYDAQ
jgi:hypothetical protein